MRILVAEDEKNLNRLIVSRLTEEHYSVDACFDGGEAMAYLESAEYDAVVLDIMMPGEHDGLAVCKELRRRNPSIGIILLSARSQEMDKVSGLMMGADDYVTKPSPPRSWWPGSDAVYRRVALAAGRREGGARDELTSGEFTLNLRNRSFLKGKRPIELTQVEFQIMEYFFSHPGVALARGDILKHVWGAGYTGEEKIVDVNIRRLRMKVEEEPSSPRHIVTVWGLGYRWDE